MDETHERLGLTEAEARRRLEQYGPNRQIAHESTGAVRLFLSQFKSPILLLLVAAAILSGFLGDAVDGFTTVAIVLLASILSFLQENRADHSVRELLKLVATQVTVIRDGVAKPVSEVSIVPGDLVELSAGSAIPADGEAAASDGLMVDEAILTGESLPVEKKPGDPLMAGTHVQSGAGRLLVEKTGKNTSLGGIADHLRGQRPEPKFHLGVRRYGYMLVEFTLLLTMAVFAINVWRHQPLLESFLFSLALAVGLTPQLLPAIMSLTLSKGAHQLAARKVVVKRLEAIEDFGSMTVLCSDKTGTVTEGSVALVGAYDPEGKTSEEVLRLASWNAALLRSYENPIDAAILERFNDPSPPVLLGQTAYDFFRKRASIVVAAEDVPTLITKGAFEPVLHCCGEPQGVRERFENWSGQGYRVLAVASRKLPPGEPVDAADEVGMEFRGFLVFEDPIRSDTADVVRQLKQKGVRLRLLTGDNRLVAAHVAQEIGLRADHVITGEELRSLPTEALARRIAGVEVFAELDPVQKERLIVAMRRPRAVVGYIGDGINDGAALHAADVGISVSGAVDVARQAADIIMLEQGLDVISSGIDEGRRIFANTLKYIYITTSANFGNMFSMAVASLFLPFLPLLPKQILLNNLLTDIPAMSIASDAVDPDLVRKPRGWDVRGLRRFMILFGFHSSAFDLLTFWILLTVLRANPDQFRSTWFVQSALSEIVILLIIRTRRRFFRSRPGGMLLGASLSVSVAVFLLPYLPLSHLTGFTPLPARYLAAVAGITVAYGLTAEWLKSKVKLL